MDFSHLQLLAIFSTQNIDIAINEQKIPVYNFSLLPASINQDVYWLICGYQVHMREIGKMSHLLQHLGVPQEFILNFTPACSGTYLGNLKLALTTPQLDFFATGISYMEVGLDIEQFSGLHGINLSSTGQDLYYGYQTARYLLQHREKKPRFCLIGLSPYSFGYDIAHSFSAQFYLFQYALVFHEWPEDCMATPLYKAFCSENFQQQFQWITKADADPNYQGIKQGFSPDIIPRDLLNFEQELQDISGKKAPTCVNKNIQVLTDYLTLCQQHEVLPILLVLPFSPLIRSHYPGDELQQFYILLAYFQAKYAVTLLDFFQEPLDYTHFYNLTHLNQKGAAVISQKINHAIKNMI